MNLKTMLESKIVHRHNYKNANLTVQKKKADSQGQQNRSKYEVDTIFEQICSHLVKVKFFVCTTFA